MVTATGQNKTTGKSNASTSPSSQLQAPTGEPAENLEIAPEQPGYRPISSSVTAESLQRLPSQSLRIATFKNLQRSQGNHQAARIARQLRDTPPKPKQSPAAMIQRDLAFDPDWESTGLGNLFTWGGSQASADKAKEDYNKLFKPLEDLLVEMTSISQMKKSSITTRAKKVVDFIKAKQNKKTPVKWAEREQLKTDIELNLTEAKLIVTDYEKSRLENYTSQSDETGVALDQIGKKQPYLPDKIKVLQEEAANLSKLKQWDDADQKMKELSTLVKGVAKFKITYDSLIQKYKTATGDKDYAPTLIKSTWEAAVQSSKDGNPAGGLRELESIEKFITTVADSGLIKNVKTNYPTAHGKKDYCPGVLKDLRDALTTADTPKAWNIGLTNLKKVIDEVFELEKEVTALEDRANELSTEEDKEAILEKLEEFKTLAWKEMTKAKLVPIENSLQTYEVVELDITNPITTTHYKKSRQKITRKRLADIGLPVEETGKIQTVLNNIGKGKPDSYPDSWKWGEEYENRDNGLPVLGGALTYREYYVKPEKSSEGFGERRIVASSDGKKIYYTNNHYGSGNAATAFTCIKW
ncbi:MAG: hypothetical protein J0I20_31630 [Chloroflexi bacterium]|nr:hypothetical protein [Chloroflexota bacterium]OJV93680.1 MAG: hypothetical protein BGO39_15295 [Chloroflexi bacterium 54-19]